MYFSLSVLHIFALGLSVFGVAVQNDTEASQGCANLQAMFPNNTYFPGSAEYDSDINHAWSPTCVFESECVFEPGVATELSKALKILEASRTRFAVRSGGHLAKPGANGIADGVLIDMTRIRTLRFTNSTRKVIELGPGLRWVDVNNYTSPLGLAVAGGRFGDVGVPGVLLGGGIAWASSWRGWACDGVVNFEVVLAGGQIVNANSTSHSDLFWALKGGSSNFGIVTRFDVSTFPLTDIYGGFFELNSTLHYNEFVDAVATWVAADGGSSDTAGAIDPITVVETSTGAVTSGGYLFHAGSDPNPASLANFTKIPMLPISDLSVRSSLAAFQVDADTATYSATNERQLVWITGIKAVREAVYLANTTFLSAALTELRDIPNATTSITYQPITQGQLKAGAALGGDALDLSPANGGFIALQIESGWYDAQYDQRIADFSYSIVERIDVAMKAAGYYYPFNYINDAGFNQTIFPLYGGGKSLPKLQRIAKKYDPSGVFQTLMPGGFKVF